jgi:hypothetical protein
VLADDPSQQFADRTNEDGASSLSFSVSTFTALGITLEGEMPVEGPWVDRVNGLEGVQVDIVMMRTQMGTGGLS